MNIISGRPPSIAKSRKAFLAGCFLKGKKVLKLIIKTVQIVIDFAVERVEDDYEIPDGNF